MALNLYSLGEISHAEACQLAGMCRVEFESQLRDREIVRPYSVEMLDEGLRNAVRH